MPDISRQRFDAVQWTFNSVAVVLVVARISIRVRKLSRLMTDDYLILASLLLMLVSGAVYDQEFKAEDSRLGGTGLLTETATLQLRYDLVSNVLFTTVLWLIKLSFLMLYRRLMGTIRLYRLFWWILVGFLALTYVASCIVFSQICPDLSQTSCYVGNRKLRMSIASYALNTSADIFSDILILAFAIGLLRKVQIDKKQKFMLIGLFSLTTFVIAVAFLRVVVTYADPKYQIQSPLWIYLWTDIEMATAVIVASLLSFRLLFTGNQSGAGVISSRKSKGRSDPGTRAWDQARAKPGDLESRVSSNTRAYTTTTNPPTPSSFGDGPRPNPGVDTPDGKSNRDKPLPSLPGERLQPIDTPRTDEKVENLEMTGVLRGPFDPYPSPPLMSHAYPPPLIAGRDS